MAIQTKKIYKRGTSIVEMLIYLAILSFLLVVIVSLLSNLLNSQKRSDASRNVERAGIFAIERIVREIRNASSVDTAGSVLSSNPGVLKLNYTSGGASHNVRFYLENGILYLEEDGNLVGALTNDKSRLTNLVFYRILSSNSEAIKVEVTAESGLEEAYKSANFFTTAVMRGSY